MQIRQSQIKQRNQRDFRGEKAIKKTVNALYMRGYDNSFNS